MIKKLKIPYLFFILVYFNQGFSGLTGQPLYYLTREAWGLSATMLGLISFVVGFAWYVKILFGYCVDNLPIKGYYTKYYLYINYISLILVGFYVVLFGLNLTTLILTGFLLNVSIGFNDVANDKQMCMLEKKYNLQGKIQAIQWISLGLAGLLVSLGGAWISDKFDVNIAYRIATGIWLIVPISTLIYLKRRYVENKVKKKKTKLKNFKSQLLKASKDKSLIIGLIFLAFLRFCPSFGTALTIQMRENLHISKMFMGYLGATGTVLGLLGYAVYYWKAHKIPLKKLLYFSVLFSGLTSLCYLWIPNKWTILSYSFLFGIFDGVAFLTILSFMVKILPSGSEGFFYALVAGVNNLSSRLGGLLGGIIYDNLGYNFNVIIASATTLICLLFIPYLKIGEKNEKTS